MHILFTIFLENLESLKVVIFRLAYSHVCTFPAWENIVSMVFFFTPTSLDGETLHPIFPALEKLFTGAYHIVHLKSWESSIWSPNFMHLLGHRKSWNRGKLCRVSHLNKNIENKKMCFLVTSFLDNLKSLKVVIFRLAYSHACTFPA